MTELADRGRRDFISAGVAAGGGLLLGLTLSGSGKRASAADGAKSARTASQLNAWLKISADNSITIIVDRSEMGQGVYTALPMLIAEELNVNLDAIQVVAAPVGDAYVNPGNGGQVTGTSNSVQDAWEKLRAAGAQARMMLTQAAAKHWHIDIGECRAINGTIAARGKVLTYGQLAAAAAKEPIPKDVKLRPRSEFQIIGKSRARIDSPGKVDGSAEFGLDVKLPGMLYAAIAQSPVLGGKVKTLDSLAAGKMPGVRRILSTDSGVVVVADHFWQALQARKTLEISWDPGVNLPLDNELISAMLKKTAAAGAGLTARADGDGTGARVREAALQFQLRAAAAGARDHGAHELHRRRQGERLRPLRRHPGSAGGANNGCRGGGS
jgi:isoquinoline 1-oxidoreductase subunit beta